MFLWVVGLLNIIGGGILGYNTGIVSGLSLPFISCTLFSSEDHINVSLYQGLFTASILVCAALGSPLAMTLQRKWSLRKVLKRNGNNSIDYVFISCYSNNLPSFNDFSEELLVHHHNAYAIRI